MSYHGLDSDQCGHLHDDDEQGSIDRWTEIGIALRRLDPRRYVELKELAERIIQVRRDPVGQAKRAALMALAWPKKSRGSA
jgi:hypothetical protein